MVLHIFSRDRNVFDILETVLDLSLILKLTVVSYDVIKSNCMKFAMIACFAELTKIREIVIVVIRSKKKYSSLL